MIDQDQDTIMRDSLAEQPQVRKCGLCWSLSLPGFQGLDLQNKKALQSSSLTHLALFGSQRKQYSGWRAAYCRRRWM